MWEKTCTTDVINWSVLRAKSDTSGMEALRSLFPGGMADEMNFVLFSTSGTHGSYITIEEAEQLINEKYIGVTFLIVHPRVVALRFGNCKPENKDDIAFLKKLRESSHEAITGIGI